MSLTKPAQENKFSAKAVEKGLLHFVTVMKSLLYKYMMINIITIHPNGNTFIHIHLFAFCGERVPFPFGIFCIDNNSQGAYYVQRTMLHFKYIISDLFWYYQHNNIINNIGLIIQLTNYNHNNH